MQSNKEKSYDIELKSLNKNQEEYTIFTIVFVMKFSTQTMMDIVDLSVLGKQISRAQRLTKISRQTETIPLSVVRQGELSLHPEPHGNPMRVFCLEQIK